MEIFKVSMLLDIYGKLITERQYEVLDMHYNSDYSLGEIAEHLKISRQGVNDSIKKGCAMLYSYEAKLGLLKKHLESVNIISELNNLSDAISDASKEENTKKDIKAVKDKLRALYERE
ncbi:MAG: sigma factor-like helix-turn-helix DNA-binding protein [Eubacteriales bacterium]|nr:sigma factor-like helix-turn-helix DNA-binding protein [Eubacteriales bacterium]